MYRFDSRGWRAVLSGALCAFLLAGCTSDELPRAKVLPADDPGVTPTEEPGNPACQGPRDPGHVTLHRLNRAEYDNTVRDLLGDTTRPARDFPADDHGYGFDNNADVLSLAPLLMEKYAAAAEKLVEATWKQDATRTPPLVRTCAPDPADPLPCARKSSQRFARRAWRRPVTQTEVERLTGFLALAKARGDGFDAGVKLALRAVLVSPHFLFRVELDPEPDLDGAAPAERPRAGERGSRTSSGAACRTRRCSRRPTRARCTEPEELERQVRRMLADPKAQALVDNFAGQWLYTRALDPAQPGPAALPAFDDGLREAMRQETELVFRELPLRRPPGAGPAGRGLHLS